ncbi:HmrR (plasmid) [Rhizobium leguminosarum bv. trifolii WSM1325]|uniref:HmrR n=1 Tax=Rhizobium leguminosarum bv. trifolii (strain WSM1325) TaxID=395491 RepID=C6B7W2_RHILS|nr:HmrR [Rhizobium leguminosarum bv. trifolii WSM1325]
MVLSNRQVAIHAQTANLKHLGKHCHRDDRHDCPIIDEFANQSEKAPPPAIHSRFGLNGLKTEHGGR